MYSTDQLRDYSSLFSRSEVIRMLNNDFKSIDLKIKRYSLDQTFRGYDYLKLMKELYKILVEHYPNEYIYKNQFLNEWLIKELGSNKSVMFSELRLGNVIADLAMFNGVSKVFEIKSPYDKKYRLSNQLRSYKKLFNEVFIIVPEKLYSKYESIDNDCGIIVYENKSFIKVRESNSHLSLDVGLLMETLHTREYLEIVEAFYPNLPPMTSFNQFNICKDLISNIPSNELNGLFIKCMKSRKVNNIFFRKMYSHLNQISLALNFDNKQKEHLIENLKTNYIT